MRYMGTLEEIERTKRAEPTVLFLEGEGVGVATPKKHQEVHSAHSSRVYQASTPTAPSGHSDFDRLVQSLSNSEPGFALNESFREYLARTDISNPHQLGEVAISPYMQEMGAYGQRLREQELQRMLDEDEDI
jgi:hypothetical protein